MEVEITANFRDFERKLCIIPDTRYLFTLDPEIKSGATGILAYGYVDHTVGLTFEALALVKHGGGDCTVVHESTTTSMKFRASSINMDEIVPIHNDAYLKRFANHIKIMETYYDNDEVVHSRSFTELDTDRHPHFPDDVFVTFPTADMSACEKMWVRTEKYLGTKDSILLFSGTLLNEPDRDLGCHIHDNVVFGLFCSDTGGRYTVRL